MQRCMSKTTQHRIPDDPTDLRVGNSEIQKHNNSAEIKQTTEVGLKTIKSATDKATSTGVNHMQSETRGGLRLITGKGRFHVRKRQLTGTCRVYGTQTAEAAGDAASIIRTNPHEVSQPGRTVATSRTCEHSPAERPGSGENDFDRRITRPENRASSHSRRPGKKLNDGATIGVGRPAPCSPPTGPA